MTPYLIGGALVAIAVLAGIWWALRRARDIRVGSPEDAADAADRSLAGFATAGAVIGADGGGALVVDGRGRVAAVKRRGRRIAVREVTWSALRSTREGIVVETDDRRFGSVTLRGVDALDIRRLTPDDPKPEGSHPR